VCVCVCVSALYNLVHVIYFMTARASACVESEVKRSKVKVTR